jgi:putative DNA primase/helicase
MSGFDLGSAAALAEALGGVPEGRGRFRAPCPVHGGRSLQIRDGNSKLLLRCWGGCTFEEVTAALREQGIGSLAPDCQRVSATVNGSIDAAQAIFDRAGPAAGTPVETYLRARGITLPVPAVLQFQAQAPHRCGWYLPAMAAPVVDVNGEQVGVHLTYLCSDGSGKFPFPDTAQQRECRGPISGGAVRLAEPNSNEPLLIGEGIETTLSAMRLLDLPGWAALSTSGLRALQLPPEIKNIAIAVDHDGNGAGQAAAAAAQICWRAEGRTVRCLVPPHPGDFNDVLLRGAGQ